jgi:hypothetical protein
MELIARCFWCGGPHAAEHALSVCPSCLGSYRSRRFPMGPLQMSGSFALDDVTIDETVGRTSPGNYALGFMDGDTFQVFFVGRSDSDVKSRLHEWVGTPSECHRFTSSAQAAWGVRRRGAFPVDAPTLGPVGSGLDSSYTRFAYSYATSAAAAFEKECRSYDDFGGSGGLDNTAAPVSTSPEA